MKLRLTEAETEALRRKGGRGGTLDAGRRVLRSPSTFAAGRPAGREWLG